MSGSISVKHLNEVPDFELRNRVKHYYLRAKRAEKELSQKNDEIIRLKDEMRTLEARMGRLLDFAEDILENERG